MKHIEERVELDLRVWRYLLPPSLETPGHEIMGSQQVWQPIKPTDHFICDTGNKLPGGLSFGNFCSYFRGL